MYGLDGTPLATLPAGVQQDTPLIINEITLSATVDANDVLTLVRVHERGSNEHKRRDFEMKDFHRRLGPVKAEVKALQADSSAFLEALQRGDENLDMDELKVIQGKLGLQKKTLREMQDTKTLDFKFNELATKVTLQVRPHQVWMAPGLIRAPFLWQPANSVSVLDTVQERTGQLRLSE